MAIANAAHITDKVSVLGYLTVSAVSLFLLAHLIFPVLFLPSRYSFYSARHVEFYDEMRQRLAALVTAHYSADLSEVQSFISTYGIDLWVVSKDFTNPTHIEKRR